MLCVRSEHEMRQVFSNIVLYSVWFVNVVHHKEQCTRLKYIKNNVRRDQYDPRPVPSCASHAGMHDFVFFREHAARSSSIFDNRVQLASA